MQTGFQFDIPEGIKYSFGLYPHTRQGISLYQVRTEFVVLKETYIVYFDGKFAFLCGVKPAVGHIHPLINLGNSHERNKT